jgi:DMSO/TMAO reductase YedYZ molybdopterin-dependent catalytic subunit
LVTVPLTAVFFLANRLAGLPFVPYDLFDFVSKLLPGDVVRTTIETMVKVIRGLNLGETSSTAKSVEQLIGLGQFIVFGIVAGAVLFAVIRRRKIDANFLPGLIMGVLVGIVFVFISRGANLTINGFSLSDGLWVLALFAAWGVAYNWIYNDLSNAGAASAPAAPEVSASAVQLDRRQFMIKLGGAAAVITVLGGGVGLLLGKPAASVSNGTETPISPAGTTGLTDGDGHLLPNADDPVIPAPGTRPEYTPVGQHYRIDIDLAPPVLNEATWQLPIKGLVDSPKTFTLADLKNYESMDQFITLQCISNPLGGDLIGTTKWTGVSLQKIMADVKPQANAAWLRVTAADGFDEYVDLNEIRQDDRIMLAYAWDGKPLAAEHGFPLRIYIPDRYGMKQPKWITNIDVVDQWDEGYWVRRGWDKDAIMQTTSVIDTIATNAIVKDGDQMLVPIGGIAHAGARGISKVEVQVDGGNWAEAKLRSPLSKTTWVIWRYDWPFQEGDHTFSVRAVDGNGTPQIESVADVAPSGATGIFSVEQTIDKPPASA